MTGSKVWGKLFVLCIILTSCFLLSGFGLNDFRQEEQSPASFYETMLISGEEAFFSGEYQKAIKELEIAAFGLFQRKLLAAKAYILMSLSYYHLDDRDKAGGFIREAASLVSEQELGAIELNINDSNRKMLESMILEFDIFNPAADLPVQEEESPSFEKSQPVNREEKTPPPPVKEIPEKQEAEKQKADEREPKKKIETETVDNKSVKKKEIIPEKAEKKAVQPKKAIPEKVDNKSDQQMKSKPKTIDERIAQLVEQRKKQQSEQSKTKTEEKTQEKDNQIEGLEEMFVQDEPVQEKILSEIRIQKRTNSIDISILFQPYTQHQVFEIIDPPPKRIVIDIYNISEIKSGRSIRVNDFGIVSIRTGMYKINIARVVFDAEGDLPPYRIEMTEGGLKLVIEKSAL